MKNNLMTNLRASVFALSAASLAVTVPAYADPSNDKQMGGNESKNFTQLDQNSDQRLNKEEIQKFAEDKKMDAEQLLSRYDRNGDDALDQQEFQRLSAAKQEKSSQNMARLQGEQSNPQASADQENNPDGPKVVVDQKPTQINVEKPAAQVTIDQPKPKVTITTQDPKVEVEQSEPRVSVQQSEPQVSVDQAKPNVEVQDAKPEVQVSRSEPNVNVNEQEPQVSFESADAERDTSEQRELATESRDEQNLQRQNIAAQNEQQIQRDSSNQTAQSGELYNRPISELRSAEVVDEQGETLGNVAEVVVKQDGSEAGFIISTTGADTEQRHVYRAAEDFDLEGDQIVFTEDPQSLTEPQGFMAQDFMAAPGEENRTLSDVVNREGLSAR